MLIAVTGALVRVTESGLGCPTWPTCNASSLVPVPNPVMGQLHQWIEFSNRMLGGVLGLVSLVCVLIALRVQPFRRRVLLLALTLPAGVAVQAVIGGITVRTGLQWWTVAAHFLASMPLIWLAVLFVKAVNEGDASARPILPTALIRLQVAQAVILGVLLIAGTLVTSAGPHAGDSRTPRLQIPIPTLVQAHADLLFLFLGMVIALGFGMRIGGATKAVWVRYWTLIGCVVGQGMLGMIQYWTGVPDVLVLAHVLGATLVVAATAALWTASKSRGPIPTKTPATPVETVPSAEPVTA